jgi:type VI secretion system secreted protein Hcp
MSNAIFLKLDGADGESTDAAHDKEINVDSFSWGVANTATMDAGAGVSAGKAMADYLTVSKIIDTSSPVMIQRCASGKVFSEGTLSIQRAGGEKVQALELKLTNIYVANYQISDSAGSGGLPAEQVVLAYDKVELKYTKQKEDGSADATVECGYDLKKNEVT